MEGSTETLDSTGRQVGPVVEWALVVALDCDRLAAPPVRLGIERVVEVEIGRSDEPEGRRSGAQLRIDLPDRWASQVHARLRRVGDAWEIEDAGSKNGTRVNGRSLHRAVLADGDVIECGGTFMVLRQAPGPIADRTSPAAGAIPNLRTLSPVLEGELAQLPRVARSRVPVVVRGASGTGKEVVAAAIHELSGRKGPLVAVNCGSIPPALVESELFGSRRGAFSGAEDRPGLVRNAEHGTLFLDEIAELPAASQAALLRFLQSGEVRPVGAEKMTVVDVRVVAATHRAMEDLIAAGGGFRHDLYARLRGYELRLPTLRERLEDLGLLIATLLERHDPRAGQRRLSRVAARALFMHPWAYNVRELEHVLCAAIAVAPGAEIGIDDLRLVDSDADPEASDSPSQVARLVDLVDKHASNVSAIARELGTSRSQVRRLLARHAIIYRAPRS